MTTILLVRHAEVEGPPDVLCGRNNEVGLSRRGLERAARLALNLRRLSISALMSSPLRRAIQTANPIADELRLSIQISEPLNEIDYGKWTGRSFAELQNDAQWRRFNMSRSSTQIPAGESIEEVEQRVFAQLRLWAEHYAERLIVAVTHAEIIRIGALHILGLSSNYYDRIEIGTCSVSAIQMDGQHARVICLNESGTLDCLANC